MNTWTVRGTFRTAYAQEANNKKATSFVRISGTAAKPQIQVSSYYNDQEKTAGTLSMPWDEEHTGVKFRFGNRSESSISYARFTTKNVVASMVSSAGEEGSLQPLGLATKRILFSGDFMDVASIKNMTLTLPGGKEAIIAFEHPDTDVYTVTGKLKAGDEETVLPQMALGYDTDKNEYVLPASFWNNETIQDLSMNFSYSAVNEDLEGAVSGEHRRYCRR